MKMVVKLGIKRFFVAALVAVMLIPTFAETALAAGDPAAITSSQRYAMSLVTKMKGGSRLVKAYNVVRKGLKSGKSKINLSDYKLTPKEFQKVYYAVTEDHPEFFWISNYISWSTSGSRVVSCTPQYTIKSGKLKNAKQIYNAKVREIVSEVDPAISDYEKELYLHDRLAEIVTYDLSAEHAHDAYGAIVEGKAVCEGYSRAFQHLLNECGIEAFGVYGLSNSPGSTSRQNHMWNVVKLGREWYHVDLTWNDQKSDTYHTYLNLTSDEIKSDHIISGNFFKIPNAAGIEYGRQRYFEERGSYLTEYNREIIAEALIRGNKEARILIGNGLRTKDFINMLYEDIRYYGTALGLSGGLSISVNYTGNEIAVKVSET